MTAPLSPCVQIYLSDTVYLAAAKVSPDNFKLENASSDIGTGLAYLLLRQC